MNQMSESKCAKSERNIAFDALRICAMVMVTILHITGHGIANCEISQFSGVYWVVLVSNTFCLVAVNCFVLITGFFLSDRKTKLRKIVMMWLQVWTYSVGVYLILCVVPTTGVEFSFTTLIQCGLPILSNQYWFFKCYFLLYLLSPVLNILISTMEKAVYRNVLVLLLVLFCAIPSINIFGDTFGTNAGYSLTWFIVLYLVAGYIKQYPVRFRVNPIFIYVGSCLVLCAIRLIGNLAGSIIQAVANLQMNYNGPLIFLASASLLQCCTHSNRCYGKFAKTIIEVISPLVFGVYLLHDHGILSGIIWNKLANLPEVANQPFLFIARMTVILVVLFVSGVVVEIIRSSIVKCVEKLVNRMIDK